ncbi:3-isopropylmalate dehydratase [Clostridium sp. Marseille-Q2269]|uniref:LeuD/DmdB family oxidoreductase small subunit n=1 Tax=Clostridium sp. Marseille-Q2269 TaxID=2942205 RepID=UPI0020739E45|nr:3-isopropylmalate dehydratase [Clostridium sp. Marseille-Q2269]
MNNKIYGKVLKFGDNINTDIISPPQYMELSIEEASKYSMSAIDPKFSERIKKGDIIVAGKNFGSGSSRETSPLTLKYLGVGAIVVEFFARIFYRNCINIGIPVIECKEASKIDESDIIEIYIEEGEIYNISKNERYKCTKLPKHILELIECGGLFEYLKKSKK